jgi:hypothetical protein
MGPPSIKGGRPSYLYIRKDGTEMTTFDFMVSAFQALAGVTCLCLAVVIVYTTARAIYSSTRKRGSQNGRK